MARNGEFHHPVDSSVFFIAETTADLKPAEIMIWGDVEADSISSCPRNAPVWALAAKKIVHAGLRAILIECSYDSNRPKETLFGHLNTHYLLEELEVLGRNVVRERLALVRNRGAMSPTTEEVIRPRILKRKSEQPHDKLASPSLSATGNAFGIEGLNDYDFSSASSCKPAHTPAHEDSPSSLLRAQYYDQPCASPATILPGFVPTTTDSTGTSIDSYFPYHSAATSRRGSLAPALNSSRRPSVIPSFEVTNERGLPTPAATRVGTMNDMAEEHNSTNVGDQYDLEMAMLQYAELANPLEGVTVVVTHVKETWTNARIYDEDEEEDEEEPEGDKERILRELLAMSADRKFLGGVSFVMARRGVSIWV
ncbi:hypothetical protein BJ508DRAFT_413465 [Ascobolus immersus RN42]|uniref:Uncharacterized protein n=1 Tax=Ascobolus immersus RN42 TaxID=1160509 RepID=A0A3N4IBR5_ASCIM|nr:hypothetical protein BJ508DRAFT_413465 [Ascobolus immersus RN42]